MRRLFLLLLLFPVVSYAQGTTALSLKQAEALWQEHSRELSLARATTDGAAADVTSAGQMPNPDVSLNLASISPWSGYGAGGWKDKKMDNILRL